MKQIVETGEYFNFKLIKHNRISAGTIFFVTISLTFFHAFFVRPPPTTPKSIGLPELLPVVGTGILVMLGKNIVSKVFPLFLVQLRIICGLR